METSKTSTGDGWNDLPLFAEGIPASLSPKQVIAKVKKIIVTCGLGYDKPLANYDPTTQSWKMSVVIFPSEEPLSLPTLPASGMTQSGALFQQPAWEPTTSETDSSLWPTPRSSRAMADDMTTTQRRLAKIGYKSRLEEAVALTRWPTPTFGKMAGGKGAYERIQTMYSEGTISDEERKAMQAGNGGKLNPQWVEWLMGFPLGWTDLEDSGTQ